MRTFFAVEIPKEIKNKFIEIEERLSKTGADMKFVDIDGLHITTLFMGETSEAEVNILKDILEQKIEKRKLKIEECIDTKQNLMKLGSGRIDGYINDKAAIMFELKKMKALGEYKKDYSKLIVGKIISVENGYLGYTKMAPERYPYKEDFKNKLDIILKEMKKNGEIEKITEKYNKE